MENEIRNHGFILETDGWALSPLYDVNPDIYGEYAAGFSNLRIIGRLSITISCKKIKNT